MNFFWQHTIFQILLFSNCLCAFSWTLSENYSSRHSSNCGFSTQTPPFLNNETIACFQDCSNAIDVIIRQIANERENQLATFLLVCQVIWHWLIRWLFAYLMHESRILPLHPLQIIAELYLKGILFFSFTIFFWIRIIDNCFSLQIVVYLQ